MLNSWNQSEWVLCKVGMHAIVTRQCRHHMVKSKCSASRKHAHRPITEVPCSSSPCRWHIRVKRRNPRFLWRQPMSQVPFRLRKSPRPDFLQGYAPKLTFPSIHIRSHPRNLWEHATAHAHLKACFQKHLRPLQSHPCGIHFTLSYFSQLAHASVWSF